MGRDKMSNGLPGVPTTPVTPSGPPAPKPSQTRPGGSRTRHMGWVASETDSAAHIAPGSRPDRIARTGVSATSPLRFAMRCCPERSFARIPKASSRPKTNGSPRRLSTRQCSGSTPPVPGDDRADWSCDNHAL